eukprot:TRINITY_DN23903_c0_g1_i1.p1 TRINITY_DN23903_c0_g1~~TRINITY_DN23903_c0_g1_i1.p1  ORF type:complete len:412 (-),score=44.68 TRINITY_DN23903_c0_g1_i1:87-1295(-)
MRFFAARKIVNSFARSVEGTVTKNRAFAVARPFSVHVPVGKDGEGAYTAATKGCFDVINAAAPMVLKEVSTQPLRPGQAFHVADYGTADAGTSLGLLSRVVQAVREREKDKEVVIHYEDQLGNEWKSVFNHALGVKKVTDAYGQEVKTPYYLGGVFVEACGVGFHSQCYPSSSMDLGVSFTAMHWLSKSPNSLRGSPFMHAARCPDGPPQAEKIQAEEDWDCILEARAKELVKGGRFVCVNFCTSKEGYFLGQTDVGESMWDSFQRAWDKLKEQGLIDEEERNGVSFPNYYRTTQEFLAGVEKRTDLRLISAAEKVVRCPYREQYVAGKSKMTPHEYAELFVPTTRTWSHSTFKAGLKSRHTDDAKERILEQFWSNYKDLVAEAPEKHGMDYVHSYLVIEKI